MAATTLMSPRPANTEKAAPAAVSVYVDPSCPFAWITCRWLTEVEQFGGVRLTVELMSLSAVNEGKDLEDWYRVYNEQAWRPARVAAAILDSSHDAGAWPAFYAAFGRRRHVEGERDNARNIALALGDLGLPAELAGAAEDPTWDADLRRRTAVATAPLAGEGGTPIVYVNERAFFGPVLTQIPRGAAASRLWEAVSVLATTEGFSEIKGARDDNLMTG